MERWHYLFTSSWTLVQVQLWAQPQFQAVELSGVLWVSLETTVEMLPLPPYRQVLTCRVSWWVQYGSEAVPLAAVLAYMSSLPLSLQVLHQLCSHLIPEIFWIVFSLFWAEEFSLYINSKHISWNFLYVWRITNIATAWNTVDMTVNLQVVEMMPSNK